MTVKRVVPPLDACPVCDEKLRHHEECPELGEPDAIPGKAWVEETLEGIAPARDEKKGPPS